jgi:hypothetical protein
MMENELKINFVDPNQPIDSGLGDRVWKSKDEMKQYFPDQPERSKREDCIKCEPLAMNEDGSDVAIQMRCSEHCGDTVREVQ